MRSTPTADDKNEAPAAPRQVRASQLLGRTKALIILHDDARYILRITSNNKLILTK